MHFCQVINILHAVFGNILSKCNFCNGNVGSVHIFASNVCKHCMQDSNKRYVYEKCSYSHMRCTSFHENWLDITLEKSIFLP